MNGGDSDVLSLMILIAFLLLCAVTIYIVLELNKLKEYDESNEKQLTNLVNDINYNNYIISNNNPKLGNIE